MSIKNESLKSNIVYSALLSVANLIFPLITFPYITRVLSPEGIGKINFSNSIVSYFVMVVMLGIPTYGMREVARRSKDKRALGQLVQELLIINTLLLVVCIIAYFGAISLIPKFSKDFILYLLMGTQIIFNVLGVEWFYRGVESFKYITIRSIVAKVFSFVLVFALVKDESDLLIYAAITVIANAGSYLLNFWNLRKFNLEFVPFSNLRIKKHLKPLLILFATSIATNISTQVDTTMLGFVHGDVEVGYYSIAVKVKNILIALTGAVSTAVFPRLVALSSNPVLYKKLLKKVYLYLMLITAPATVFFFFYAEETVLLLAGESYRAAIVPMQIITITVFIVTFSCLFGGRVLVSLNKAGTQLNSVICGTVVNCVSNAILIPKFGVSGAATATVLSEFTVLLYCLVKVPKEYRISFEMKDVAKIIIATFMAISVASLTKNVCENVFLKFIYGAGSFGIIYLILLVMLREEVVINLIKKCKEKGIREIFKEF